MRLSYDYAAFPTPEMDGWIVQLDAVGGYSGYMVDPYVEFDSPQQMVLQIHIQQHGKRRPLEILNSTKLVDRIRLPAELHQDLDVWEKVLKFFGFEIEKRIEPRHVVI